MMKLILMMLFMIPTCFLTKNFWFHQFNYFVLFMLVFMKFSFNFQFKYLSYFLGIDLMSFSLILLTIWICALMILASSKILKNKNFIKFYLLVVIILMISLIMTFSSLNLMVFYLFFEISLIPTLILIIGWGYQPERIQAGIYLLFYTMFASLPMMISIFYYNYLFMNLSFLLLNSIDYFMVFLFMNMVFFVKMPMYFVHLWLPKAHVEAPVSGSMILAGIMLKLGGYGILRLAEIFTKIIMNISFIFISISLLGSVLISLVCMRQFDIKSLIAYSSVAHMGLIIGAIFTLNYWGICASLLMMLAHGLCSSGLFCLVNISYERIQSRSLFMMKGMMNIMPSMTLWWFLFSVNNMAAPPSLNLLSEIMLINSLISWSKFNMLMLMLISFFSAVYSLFLYSFSQHGKIYSNLYSYNMGMINEYLLLFLHWFPLNFMILKSEVFILW
uniref:NADH-ubiquinone oxidoreductase chain 4 n=1 Tax=Euaesthetus ruficapillus TaxID=295609 RepID=A0A0S2M795_9COLE|nr:NADH deshydrogenase subunit 4 [Euaesthetus ruficapillus]